MEVRWLAVSSRDIDGRPRRFGHPMALCGCRPRCKKFLNLYESDRVRSFVRPHGSGLSGAAGRYGDLRIRSKSRLRAQRLFAISWFSPIQICSIIGPFSSLPSHTALPALIAAAIMPPRLVPDRCNFLLSTWPRSPNKRRDLLPRSDPFSEEPHFIVHQNSLFFDALRLLEVANTLMAAMKLPRCQKSGSRGANHSP